MSDKSPRTASTAGGVATGIEVQMRSESTTQHSSPIRVDLAHAHGLVGTYRDHGCRCSLCREANARYVREYYAAHPEKKRAAARRDRERHADRINATKSRWRQTQRDVINRRERDRRAADPDRLAKGRAYREENRERIAENERRYRETHKEKRAAYNRAWLAEHPGYSTEYARTWRARNPERAALNSRARRARVANAEGRHTTADIAAQRTRQNGRCYWCGEKTGRHYHVDHVVPLALGGSNGPENLVISCATCNHSKSARHPMDFAGVML